MESLPRQDLILVIAHKSGANSETMQEQDLQNNQDRVAAGAGRMVGLRRAVVRWWLRGIIGGALFLMGLRVGKRPSIQ